MKEIIDKIIKTEQQAKQKLDSARQKVNAIITDAQNRAGELKEEEIRKAYAEKEELLSRAESQALDKKRLAIENAAKDAESILREKSADVNRVADKILAKIIKRQG